MNDVTVEAGETRATRNATRPSPGTEALRLTTGHANAADRARVNAWLEEGLRPGRPGRLRAEYPTILGRESSAVPITAYHEETPVSHATLLPRRAVARIGSRKVPFDIGLISFVYTDPSQRGKRFSRRVLDVALERAAAHGLGLTLLWSDIEALYYNLGFRKAGSEATFRLTSENLRCALGLLSGSKDARASTQISEAKPHDWNHILRLRDRRASGLQLGYRESKRLGRLPDMRVLVAKTADQIEAFVAVGRGDDFGGVVHEWAGSPRGVAAACLEVARQAESLNQPLFLISPADNNAVSQALSNAGIESVRQPLSWMRITNRRALRRSFNNAVPDKIGEFDALMSHPSESRRLAGLFGNGATVRASEVPPLLSFYIWGLESF